MLTVLWKVMADGCPLLYLLLVAILGVLALWAFKQAHKKKQSKSRVAWRAPSEGVAEPRTDPERRSSNREPKSYDRFTLLHLLGENIQHLTGQFQWIRKPISRSVSLDSITSLCSSAPSSARDVCQRRPRAPPSPAPVAWREEGPGWQGQLARPKRAGLQQPYPRCSSHLPMDFLLHQKPRPGRKTPPQAGSLTKRIPRLPSTARSSPVHAQPPGGRGTFPDSKVQQLLDRHIQKRCWQKEAPPFSQVPSRETKVQVDLFSQNERMCWGSQQLSTGARARSCPAPSASPKGGPTPSKPPPAKLRSPGPCSGPPGPSPKASLPPPLLICRTRSHSSLKAVTDGTLTPKGGLTEVLHLLGQKKSPLAEQPRTPTPPRQKEKAVPSSGNHRRPRTAKESAGQPGKAEEQPAELQISLTLDRKIQRLSWADDKREIPKASVELPSSARPPYLDPAFMCQNQLELPCLLAAQVGLRHESLRLAKGPAKPQCLAHTIVKSLDIEQALRDVDMCLAKGLEGGRSRTSVEYPVCLLCGRCAPHCPHPPPRHGPCLVVYPQLSVREGKVYKSLGYLLKMKRHEASKWGLVQGKDASKSQLSKERSSKRERSRSRSRSRIAHGAPPPSRASEKSPRLARQRSAEAMDLRARGPRPGLLKPAPGGAEAVRPTTPRKPPSVLRKLLFRLRRAWARVRGKKDLTSTKQSSEASLQEPAPSPNLGGPSPPSGSKAKGQSLLKKQDSHPKRSHGGHALQTKRLSWS